MNILPRDKQIAAVAALVDGASIRATERMTGAHRDTIMRLGVRVGEGCARLHDRLMRDLQVNLLQIDELWSFIEKKQAHVREDDSVDAGDAYTFTGLDSHSKAIVSYETGKRDAEAADSFCLDLRTRIVNRPEITSDGFTAYIDAIEEAFGLDVDYAQVIKEYGGTSSQVVPTERRYSPARVLKTTKIKVAGHPDMDTASTSHVERSNLTLRMGMRRFTRLTNAFSKKLRNHAAAVALFVAYYNFCRVHMTTRLTPAMAIGVTDHVWTIGELIDAALAKDPEPVAPVAPPEKPVLSRAAVGGAVLGGRPRLRVIRGGA